MTSDHDDRDLRERFDALRVEEGRAAPGFARLLARLPLAAAPRRTRALALATVGAVLVSSTLWLLWPTPDAARPPESARREAAISEWRSETDFLLHTSGLELLGASPAVGGRWVIEPIAIPEAKPESGR